MTRVPFIENWLKKAALEVQEYVRLIGAFFQAAVSPPIYRYDIIEQFDAIGVASLTVVLLTGFFTGAVLALQSGMTLDQFGARPVVGRLVSASMVKELGPVLTGLMLTGRIGSGIAAELGSMTVTDQINALRALGTDPIRKLVVPRMLAGIFMAPVLTVISDFVGILGGWIVARYPAAGGLGSLLVVDHRRALHAGPLDGAAEAVCSGVRDCQRRLPCRAADDGRHARRRQGHDNAVVAGSVAVIAADFFITRIMISLFY